MIIGSMEVRASQSLSQNISLQDVITCLRGKVIDLSYLITELQAKLEDVVNERNSLKGEFPFSAKFRAIDFYRAPLKCVKSTPANEIRSA